MSSTDLYILDGKHIILPQKTIIETSKYQLAHSIYNHWITRLLQKYVPQNIIIKLCTQQTLSNNKFANTPFISQVVKEREKWISRSRPPRLGKDQR